MVDNLVFENGTAGTRLLDNWIHIIAVACIPESIAGGGGFNCGLVGFRKIKVGVCDGGAPGSKQKSERERENFGCQRFHSSKGFNLRIKYLKKTRWWII